MKTENKVSIMKANEIIFYIKKSDTKKLQKITSIFHVFQVDTAFNESCLLVLLSG